MAATDSTTCARAISSRPAVRSSLYNKSPRSWCTGPGRQGAGKLGGWRGYREGYIGGGGNFGNFAGFCEVQGSACGYVEVHEENAGRMRDFGVELAESGIERN